MQSGAIVFCLFAAHSAAEAAACCHGGRRRWRNKGSWMSNDNIHAATGAPKWQRKIYKKIDRLAESVPGISCNFGKWGQGAHGLDSTSDLNYKLQAEKDKSKRLQEALRKQLEAKDQELMQEKAEKAEKAQERSRLKQQIYHCKPELELKVHELDQQIAKLAKADQQADHYKSKLELKVHELDKSKRLQEELRKQLQAKDRELMQEKAEKHEKVQEHLRLKRQIHHCNNSRPELELKVHELEQQIAKLAKALFWSDQQADHYKSKLDLKIHELEQQRIDKRNKEILSERDQAKEMTPAPDGDRLPSEFFWTSFFAIFATVIAVMVTPKLFKERKENMILRSELTEKRLALDLQTSEHSVLKAEFDTELGGMMKTDSASQNLGTDFTYHIHDERVDQGIVRYIKIQCPGARHSDVSVEIIFNGCIVTINRQASRGVGAIQWEQRFQFRPSEGLFEFKEDQATLDRGFLTLVFRAFAFQSRPFRFPKHFDLAETDIDDAWEYSQENATVANVMEPSVHGNDTAPGRLEMTAAAAAEFGDDGLEARAVETSGSPIYTEDYEAARMAISLADVQPSDSICGETENAHAFPVVLITPDMASSHESPELTGEDHGAQQAMGSELSSEEFEKVNAEEVSVMAEDF